jgi:hypothetical protein
VQLAERDAPFQPGQRRAEAVVDAVPEGELPPSVRMSNDSASR